VKVGPSSAESRLAEPLPARAEEPESGWFTILFCRDPEPDADPSVLLGPHPKHTRPAHSVICSAVCSTDHHFHLILRARVCMMG
jgi:hypothetical protein